MFIRRQGWLAFGLQGGEGHTSFIAAYFVVSPPKTFESLVSEYTYIVDAFSVIKGQLQI